MKTILVVEDTEDLRELFMEVLRREGYEVVGAENGQEALTILSASLAEPCLVLLDLMMPVMDGETFLRTLQETPDGATLPVIVVSATVGDRYIPGAAGLVKKPVAPSVLVNIVRDCCGPP
jgi:two-component system, chemotaxis family, chemotaxis protein CheY